MTGQELCDLWNSCSSVKEVGERLDISANTAAHRGHYWRAKGYPLKDMYHHVRNDEFIRVYNSSSSPSVAADRLGLRLKTVSDRAYRLRKRGYAVRRFRAPNGAPPVPKPSGDVRKHGA